SGELFAFGLFAPCARGLLIGAGAHALSLERVRLRLFVQAHSTRFAALARVEQRQHGEHRHDDDHADDDRDNHSSAHSLSLTFLRSAELACGSLQNDVCGGRMLRPPPFAFRPCPFRCDGSLNYAPRSWAYAWCADTSRAGAIAAHGTVSSRTSRDVRGRPRLQ